jgi:hypothetical protein
MLGLTSLLKLEKEFVKVIEIPRIHPEIREKISSPRKNTEDDIPGDER